VTSTPHASISYGSHAIEAMQSTINSAGWSAASSARRTAPTSLRTDDAVSVWTMSTALIDRCVSSRSRVSTAPGSIAAPSSAIIISTFSPSNSAISAQTRANTPHSSTSTWSPRDSVFDSVIAQAP
jgi:hypothetical protein